MTALRYVVGAGLILVAAADYLSYLGDYHSPHPEWMVVGLLVCGLALFAPEALASLAALAEKMTPWRRK